MRPWITILEIVGRIGDRRMTSNRVLTALRVREHPHLVSARRAPEPRTTPTSDLSHPSCPLVPSGPPKIPHNRAIALTVAHRQLLIELGDWFSARCHRRSARRMDHSRITSGTLGCLGCCPPVHLSSVVSVVSLKNCLENFPIELLRSR